MEKSGKQERRKKPQSIAAYCWRTGRIQFGSKIPEGAIPIAHGSRYRLKKAVEVVARWSYPSVRGGRDSVALVPGIPEASSDAEAFIALDRFIDQVKRRVA